MSQTSNNLPENQQSYQKSKSQNGGRSTNLSEGSNQIDEQFKVQKGQKFEFINEQTNQWPQWSVAQQSISKQSRDENIQTNVLKKTKQQQQLQNDILWHRGMSGPIKFYPIQKQLEDQQEQNPQKQKKKSLARGIVDKVKGWFK